MCKSGIIGKWQICCVWGNGQDFGKSEKSLYQVPLPAIWYKNLNLLLEVCILPNVLGINFFHNLTCWRCDALLDLVPHVQFKKREKRPWRSVTFNKVADFTVSNTSPWVFFTFLNCTNGTKLHIAPHLKAVGILILLYFWYERRMRL